ncbi:MAG: hypothetical protein R3B06_27435 [Kofleriaceae bacterium]
MQRRHLLAPVVALGLAGCGATHITVAHQASAGEVATAAPAFALARHRGGELTSAALAGHRVALVFYRGHW